MKKCSCKHFHLFQLLKTTDELRSWKPKSAPNPTTGKKASKKKRTQTYPVSNDTSPANDAGLQPGVGLDVSASQHCAALDAHAILYDNIWTDGHVGTYPAVVADLGA